MYHSSHYAISFERLIAHLLPTFLRTPSLLAYVGALIAPINTLWRALTKYRTDTLYRVTHTGQVVYLQKVLNDRFDKAERRITIRDGIINEPTYLYPSHEAKPIHLDHTIYTREELAFKDVDFVVVLPSELLLTAEEELRMNALISAYKLATKTYTITHG